MLAPRPRLAIDIGKPTEVLTATSFGFLSGETSNGAKDGSAATTSTTRGPAAKACAASSDRRSVSDSRSAEMEVQPSSISLCERAPHIFGVNDGGAPGGGAATESVVARAGAARRAECRCT